MDPQIWSALPTPLIDNLLARIRLPDLLRLCTVCKRWNNLRFDPVFAAEYRRIHISDKESGFLIAGATRSSPSKLFYVDAHFSRVVPVSFLQGHYFVLAACDGLFLVEMELYDSRGFLLPNRGEGMLVFNPCTKMQMKIPEVSHTGAASLRGLYRDMKSGAFHVFYSDLSTGTRIFYSTTQKWRKGPKVPFDEYNCHKEPVCSRGKIIWRIFCGSKRIVLMFDGATEMFSQINHNKELGVGCVGDDLKLVVNRKFDIQVKHEASGVSKQLGILPRSLWKKEWSDVMYFWNQAKDPGEKFEYGDVDVNTHVVRSDNLIVLRAENCKEVILFNLLSKTWYQMSKNPLEQVYALHSFSFCL